ncbi:MAG: hypothetical protein HY298_24075, partial [Verrucomicrobia bacterium]|nr:hypothetical protein [Verrucomicrobiota bacterium]
TNLGCNPASIPVCNLDPTNVFAIDDCPTNDIPVITCASVDATNGCVRTRTLTYTATGGCGNTATKTTVITWTVDTLPVLSIGLQGTNVVVSWPVPCCNPFVLEQTPSLTLPITWTPAPTPIVGGGSNTVTVPIGTGNTFYRLRYP